LAQKKKRRECPLYNILSYITKKKEEIGTGRRLIRNYNSVSSRKKRKKKEEEADSKCLRFCK